MQCITFIQLRQKDYTVDTDEECFFNHTNTEKRLKCSGLYEECFANVLDFDSPGAMNGPLEAAIACCLAFVSVFTCSASTD